MLFYKENTWIFLGIASDGSGHPGTSAIRRARRDAGRDRAAASGLSCLRAKSWGAGREDTDAGMGKDLIEYNVLVENGLRSVVREALRRVAAEGWPGTHHAYITFKTAAPGVEVPDFLQTRYPDELTIVLQHQFWDLEVDDGSFSVTLSFNKVGQRIVVPFAALTSYADPSVQFGLQFGVPPEARGKKGVPKAVPEAGSGEAGGEKVPPEAGGEKVPPEAGGEKVPPEAGGEKIVALDRFRKK